MSKITLCLIDDGENFFFRSTIDTLFSLSKYNFEKVVVIAVESGNHDYINSNYPTWNYYLIDSPNKTLQSVYMKMMEVVPEDTEYLITIGSGSVFTISSNFIDQALSKISFDKKIVGVCLSKNSLFGKNYKPEHGEFYKMMKEQNNESYAWPFMFSRPSVYRFNILKSIKMPFINRFFEFHIVDELYAKGYYIVSVDEKTVIYQKSSIFSWNRTVENLFIINKINQSKLTNFLLGQGFGYKSVEHVKSKDVKIDDKIIQLFANNDFYYDRNTIAKYLTHLGIVMNYDGEYCIVLENDFVPNSGFIENLERITKEFLDKTMIIFGPNTSGYIFRKNVSEKAFKILNSKGFPAFMNSEHVIRLPSESYLGTSTEIPLNVKNFDGWIFYSGMDSYGYDSKYEPNTSIEELINKANNDPSIIAVNTLGYMKHRVCDVSKLGSIPNIKSVNDGIYIRDQSKAINEIIKKLVEQKDKRPNKSDLTFTITTCKRYNLFRETIDTLLLKCEDITLIDRWLCIDDNSSEEDRIEMQERYPFFDYIFKTPEEKGHAKSLNMLFKAVDTKYVMHFEDDWLCNNNFKITCSHLRHRFSFFNLARRLWIDSLIILHIMKKIIFS